MRITTLFAAAVLSFGVAAVGFAADTMPAGVKIKDVADGKAKVLSDAKGMTLYTYDNDTVAGKSSCNDQCAQYWPPLAAAADAKNAGAWTVVTRDDGSKQWAFKGKPLYTFVKDAAAADFNGNGMPKEKPVWHCAVPG